MCVKGTPKPGWDLITYEQWALCLFLPWSPGSRDQHTPDNGEMVTPVLLVWRCWLMSFSHQYIFFTTVIMIRVWDIWINTANNAFIYYNYLEETLSSWLKVSHLNSDKLISCEAEAVCNWNVFHYSPIMRQWDTTIISRGASHLAQ